MLCKIEIKELNEELIRIINKINFLMLLPKPHEGLLIFSQLVLQLLKIPEIPQMANVRSLRCE